MRLNSEVCAKGFFWICFESQGSSNTGGLKIDVGLECYREEMMLDLGHVVVVILAYCTNALLVINCISLPNFSTCMVNYPITPDIPMFNILNILKYFSVVTPILAILVVFTFLAFIIPPT
ncbi:hypothetical protein MKW92_005193 [Papaver armeniacum]|nr:hypothetical protein MKW92_005193 [Papaver armeniacum]